MKTNDVIRYLKTRNEVENDRKLSNLISTLEQLNDKVNVIELRKNHEVINLLRKFNGDVQVLEKYNDIRKFIYESLITYMVRDLGYSDEILYSIKEGKLSFDYPIDTDIIIMMLLLNTRNRYPNDRTYKRYGFEMREGRWITPTTDSIGFDRNNKLTNGQHRAYGYLYETLMGSVLDSIYFTFKCNLSLEVFKTLDTGKKRDNTDYFSIKLGNIEVDKITTKTLEKLIVLNKGGFNETADVKNEEITLDLESVKESVNFCKRPDVGLREVALKANSKSIAELNIFAVAHYMIKTIESAEVADEFIANTATPIFSRRDINNPTYVLRKYLDRRKYEGSVEFSKAGKMIAFVYGLAYLHMNDQTIDDFKNKHGEEYNKFVLETPNSVLSRMPDFFGSLENMVF